MYVADEESVSVVSLDEPLSFDSDSEFTDEDLHDFVSRDSCYSPF